MENIKNFSNNLSINQARFIYGTAIALVIATLVTSIILNHNGTLAKSLGNGMSGRGVIALTGGLGVGLWTLMAATIWGCRGKRPKEDKADGSTQEVDTIEIETEKRGVGSDQLPPTGGKTPTQTSGLGTVVQEVDTREGIQIRMQGEESEKAERKTWENLINKYLAAEAKKKYSHLPDLDLHFTCVCYRGYAEDSYYSFTLGEDGFWRPEVESTIPTGAFYLREHNDYKRLSQLANKKTITSREFFEALQKVFPDNNECQREERELLPATKGSQTSTRSSELDRASVTQRNSSGTIVHTLEEDSKGDAAIQAQREEEVQKIREYWENLINRHMTAQSTGNVQMPETLTEETVRSFTDLYYYDYRAPDDIAYCFILGEDGYWTRKNIGSKLVRSSCFYLERCKYDDLCKKLNNKQTITSQEFYVALKEVLPDCNELQRRREDRARQRRQNGTELNIGDQLALGLGWSRYHYSGGGL